MPETLQEMLSELPKRFDPAAWKGETVVLAFIVTGDAGGQWVARIDDGELSVTEGPADDADMVMTASENDFVALINGELNPVSAFMQGRVRIDGDMSLAVKLQNLLSG